MKQYKPNLKRLDELTEQGYLRKVVSPCRRLFLYNYTDKCTFERKWNEHTLNARGTVYELATNKIVAQAFSKFFNFGELSASKARNLLKQDKFDVYEKADGSLAIIYHYDGKWRVNTRGSFTSDQAIKATQMLDKYNLEYKQKDITILAEIIYPENRIIVDYGEEEKLVVLGAFKLDGKEISYEIVAKNAKMPFTPKYEFDSIQAVIDEQSKLGKMEEGFVVKFEDGYRVKFKSAEYLKVARILSNMTPLNFWKNMKNGFVDKSILEEIPEEFREDSDNIRYNLELSYSKVFWEIVKDYDYAIKSIGGECDIETTRKKLGLFLKDNRDELKYPDAMFPRLLNQGVDKCIMKSIRPTGNKI